LKKNKGDSFYGGSTNTGIVASELYTHAIGVDVKRVNYRSAFDGLNEMMSGRLDFYFTDVTTALGQIAAGRYRPLAVTGSKRSAAHRNTTTHASRSERLAHKQRVAQRIGIKSQTCCSPHRELPQEAGLVGRAQPDQHIIRSKEVPNIHDTYAAAQSGARNR
jgi:Tripartite tricarboxylate transporter family receptor